MITMFRSRAPMGASVGQSPAVVFYVSTMFTLIVLVMHIWLRKHYAVKTGAPSSSAVTATLNQNSMKRYGEGDMQTLRNSTDVLTVTSLSTSGGGSTESASLLNSWALSKGSWWDPRAESNVSRETNWLRKWLGVRDD